MANNKLFSSVSGKNQIKAANVVNEAGGVAYELSDKLALAQLALTGTFNNTFYTTDADQLKKALELANKCPVEYVAKLAVYSREVGLMKDTPALLAAVVASKNSILLTKIFNRVINDPKMLRNFVQIVRSGVTGRKSFGSCAKRLIKQYFDGLTDEQLFRADVGNNPSLQDIIKMVHPKAKNSARNTLYAYLLDREYQKDAILPLVTQFEEFKQDMTKEMPNVPFQKLTALKLTNEHWKLLASRASWNQIRQNLNSFSKHGVLADKEIETLLASKLQDPEQVRRAKVFPYQLFSTFINMDESVPASIKIALQKATEVATENVPEIAGEVEICLDVSGSMRDPVTGRRGSVSTKMRCIDVASLITAAIVRKNPLAKVTAFDTAVKQCNINSLDTVATNAQKLAAAGANGGTDCAVALRELNNRQSKAQTVIYVSDNQSWVGCTTNGDTPMMREWANFKKRNPNAKLISVDIAPYTNAQVYSRNDVLLVGGFSDQVFEVIANFISCRAEDMATKMVESVDLGIDLETQVKISENQ